MSQTEVGTAALSMPYFFIESSRLSCKEVQSSLGKVRSPQIKTLQPRLISQVGNRMTTEKESRILVNCADTRDRNEAAEAVTVTMLSTRNLWQLFTSNYSIFSYYYFGT